MRPCKPLDQYSSGSFPRVSGDAPIVISTEDPLIPFSPRERGCARAAYLGESQLSVFPA